MYGKFKDRYEEELAKVLNPAGLARITSWLSPEDIAKQYHSSYETTEFKLPSVDPFMENEQERKTVAMQLLKIHIDRTKHSLQEEPNVIFLGKGQLTQKLYANTIDVLDYANSAEESNEDELKMDFFLYDPDFINHISTFDSLVHPTPSKEEAKKLALLMDQNFKKKSTYPAEKLLQVYKPCILNCGNNHPF